MLQKIYVLSFVLAFIYLFLIITKFKNKVSPYYILLFSTILITNFGYLQMNSSSTLNGAIFANQTTYLGSSFSSFFVVMCLADLCKIKINNGIQIFFICWGSLIFFLSSTFGTSGLYYKSLELIQHHGVCYLQKTNGPLHILYPIYLMVNIVIGYALIIKSFFRRRKVSYKVCIFLMLAMTISVIGYLLEKNLDLEIHLVPIFYDLTATIVMFLLSRISTYDVHSYSSDFMEENKTNGFVLVDSKCRFLGLNDSAKKFFPELETLTIDSKIKPGESVLLNQIEKWIKREDKSTSTVLEKDGKFFEVRYGVFKKNIFRSVYCFHLLDDTEQRKYTKLIESYNENLKIEVDKKTKALKKVHDDFIVGMANAVENRDSNTGGHIRRTSDVVKIFVKHLLDADCFVTLTKDFANCVIKSAPLHDFGKIGIPDVILNKPGKFTDEEYEIMKQHSAKGAVIVEQMLQNSGDPLFKKIAVDVAHYHHEKFDGTGYPEHLSGYDIPFAARIMALADVFDALVSKRVYKEKFSYDKAFCIIEESSGTHFDPELCKKFLECKEQLIELYETMEK